MCNLSLIILRLAPLKISFFYLEIQFNFSIQNRKFKYHVGTFVSMHQVQ